METLRKIIFNSAIRAIAGIMITRVVVSWFEGDKDQEKKEPLKKGPATS
jgi:hypothetical protein